MSEIESSVCYCSGPLTVRDYDEAITDLLAAKHALQRGERGGCDVCGSDEHWPSECDHNPLRLARKCAEAKRVYRCWHCGFEARTEAEGLEHFGRSEFEEPACRRPFRTMDEIDAKRVGMEWIEAIGLAIQERTGEPCFIEAQSRPQNDWYMALYQGARLVACAFVFRDPMNFSVLVRWLPAVEVAA